MTGAVGIEGQTARARRVMPRLGRRLLVAAIIAVIAAWVLVAEPFTIPSHSMEPTLRPGDRVLVLKPALLRGALERRQLIAFRAPDGGVIELKRIVALPGDSVGLEDGVLTVNGKHISEPFMDQSRVDSVYFGPVTVPAGSVFVMGDNRGDSHDSRNFGPVPDRDVIGSRRDTLLATLAMTAATPHPPRLLLAGLLALLVLVLAPAAASAHASLEATLPTVGRPLDKAPATVQMRFSEKVETRLGQMKVFDGRGRQVQQGGVFHPAGKTENWIAVRLPPTLPDATYTATYRVISADSHPVTGGFTFAVGPGGQPGAIVAGSIKSGQASQVGFSIVRTLQYTSIAAFLGGLAFLILCWLPGLRDASGGSDAWRRATEAFDARSRLLLLGAAALGLVSALLGIVAQGAAAQAISWWDAMKWDVIQPVVETTFGQVWGVAALVWVGLFAGVAVRRTAATRLQVASLGATGLAARDARPLLLLAVPAALLVLLPALAGHASVQSPVWALLPANIIHVLAMSAWLGGIVFLVAALPIALRGLDGGEHSGLAAAVISRFSALAGVAMSTLIVTGIIQSLIEIGPLTRLYQTGFGRALLIKIVLVLGLLALAGLNRQRLLPALRGDAGAVRAPGEKSSLLRRTLRAELLLGVAALTATGVLAAAEPGRTAPTGSWSKTEAIGPGTVGIKVDPARPGANTIEMQFTGRGGAAYPLADLQVTAANPRAGIAPINLGIQQLAIKAGLYKVYDSTLVPGGTWVVRVTARTSRFDEDSAQFNVPIR